MPDVWIYNDWKHHIVAKTISEKIKTEVLTLEVKLLKNMISYLDGIETF